MSKYNPDIDYNHNMSPEWNKKNRELIEQGQCDNGFVEIVTTEEPAEPYKARFDAREYHKAFSNDEMKEAQINLNRKFQEALDFLSRKYNDKNPEHYECYVIDGVGFIELKEEFRKKIKKIPGR